jgi:hypothetical protein
VGGDTESEEEEGGKADVAFLLTAEGGGGGLSIAQHHTANVRVPLAADMSRQPKSTVNGMTVVDSGSAGGDSAVGGRQGRKGTSPPTTLSTTSTSSSLDYTAGTAGVTSPKPSTDFSFGAQREEESPVKPFFTFAAPAGSFSFPVSGAVTEPPPSSVLVGGRREVQGNKCSRCLQPKRGHVCPAERGRGGGSKAGHTSSRYNF